jgi:hypothetical protein
MKLIKKKIRINYYGCVKANTFFLSLSSTRDREKEGDVHTIISFSDNPVRLKVQKVQEVQR